MSEAKVYDYTEYSYSKQVLKDYPRLIGIFDKLIPVLEQYIHYTAAYHTLQAAQDSRALLRAHLNYYEKVNAKKGLKDNE